MTRLNKPKVKNVIGKDRNCNIGWTTFCKSVSITAVRIRAAGLSNEMCEMKLLISQRATALAINNTIKSPLHILYYYIRRKNKGKIGNFHFSGKLIKKEKSMIFISGILYILLVILGFFVEIKNFILIAMMLIFAISLFKERELLRGVGSIKTKIISILFLIILIFILSLIQEKMAITNYTFIANDNKVSYSYLIVSYLVLTALIETRQSLK